MPPDEHAWHEAGHAVAAHLLGGAVCELSLESELDGATGHARIRWPAAGREEHARRLAAVALAGPLAERVFLGEDVLHDPSALSAWRADWDAAEAQLAQLHALDDHRERARRAILSELLTLFEQPTTYEALARVADALDAHGTLDEFLFEEALAQG